MRSRRVFFIGFVCFIILGFSMQLVGAQETKVEIIESLIDEALKNNPQIHIPIIGNGDIDSPQRAKEMFDKYGVDAIMVGRAAIGRPWLFRDIRHYLDTGEMLPSFTVREQVDLIIEHIQIVLETKEPKRAVISMRRFFAVSFKGLFNFRETRIRLLRAEDPDSVFSILEEIREKWGDQPLSSVPSNEEK